MTGIQIALTILLIWLVFLRPREQFCTYYKCAGKSKVDMARQCIPGSSEEECRSEILKYQECPSNYISCLAFDGTYMFPIYNSPGPWYIRCKGMGQQYMTEAGTTVVGTPFTGADNQKWKLAGTAGSLRIRSVSNNYYLNIEVEGNAILQSSYKFNRLERAYQGSSLIGAACIIRSRKYTVMRGNRDGGLYTVAKDQISSRARYWTDPASYIFYFEEP